jgi:N-acetyl-anhydromuramyl-L-alanine amidase AmpD
VLETQTRLHKIGYAIKITGEQDRQSQMVVRAFQARYVPEKFSGILDNTTEAIIFSIAKKYR